MLLALASGLAWNQGLNTQVNKNDWEEINFDFDSSILVDGFPSLLRLAEQLQANPGHRVLIEGYTDRLGNAAYNQTLGLARANAVRDFLLKYGATATQLTTSSHGASAPLVSDQGNRFRKTDEARFMNRRVALTVTDAQGRPIGLANGSTGDAIRAINGQAGPASVGAPVQSNATTGIAAQAGPGRAGQSQAGQDQAQTQAGTPGRGSADGAQGPAGQAGVATSQQVTDCCDQVLKRLDKLDEIAALMKDLADQNAQLRRDVDGLRQNQLAMQNALQGPGRGGQATATAQAGPGQAGSAGQDGRGGPGGNSGLGTSNSRGAQSATTGSTGSAFGNSRTFQSLAFNVGADDRGKVAVNGRGRFFAPLGDNVGFQAQGEYYYLRGQREGQFDLGIVDRFSRRFQAGLFGSFKTVTLTGNQTSGTLGQGSFVLDYFFGRGKVGLFASKAFKDNALVNRANPLSADGLVQRNIIEERYLKVVEQIGVSSTFALVGNTYAEANLGYLRSAASSNRAGGSLRFVMPVNNRVAFTVEGGVNETYLPLKGTQQGRAAIGVQLGNFMRPKEYLAADHAVPMEIPRVRYETLTRRTRTGNDPPVADAGPDLSNLAAGVVQLDGSNSSDPDGDPLTYQWTQEAGPAVAITTATAARATFTAAAGQIYSFRLSVKDNQGGQGTDRVQLSTGGGARVQILSFESTPRQINGGEVATLSWRVLNADTVTISGLGTVAATGSRAVTPSATSTYILTAKNSISEESANTTVVITASRFLTCYASPATIKQGETSTLTWQSNGATGVSIAPGIGSVGSNGSVAVTPTANTTYTLTTSGGSLSDSCTVTVAVNTTNGGIGGAALPAIIHFSASPSTIEKGEKTNLEWSVIDADTITISTQGAVPQFGTRLVSPTEFTTYVLTATNAAGSVTAEVRVTVYTIPPPEIVSFTVDKPTIPAPSTPVKLTCNTTGAVTVRIGDQVAQFFTATAVLDAYPPVDTTYTCTATNSKGQTVTKSVTVRIAP
jgi:hypothetical protein